MSLTPLLIIASTNIQLASCICSRGHAESNGCWGNGMVGPTAFCLACHAKAIRVIIYKTASQYLTLHSPELLPGTLFVE